MGVETTIETAIPAASKVCPQSGQTCDLGDACAASRRLLNDRGVIGGVGIECMRAARLVVELQDAFGQDDYRPLVGHVREQDYAS